MLPLSTALSFHWMLHKRQRPNAAVYTVSEWNYYGGNGRMTTSIPPMGAVSSWNTRIICWAGSTGVLDGGIGSCGGVDVGIKPMSGDRETESVWVCVVIYTTMQRFGIVFHLSWKVILLLMRLKVTRKININNFIRFFCKNLTLYSVVLILWSYQLPPCHKEVPTADSATCLIWQSFILYCLHMFCKFAFVHYHSGF